MSAGLALLQNFTPQQATTEPLTSVPSSITERTGAAWEAAQTPDRYWNIQAARKDRAQKVIDDLHGLTGERLRNPFDMAPTMEEIRENVGQPTTALYAKRLENLKAKAAAARASLPDLGGMPQDFLDVDAIDRDIGATSTQARNRDASLVDTGHGIPAFLAAGAGEMASPHGVASMFLPVSRLPYAAAEGIGASWLRNIGKEALYQGILQAGVQIPASVIDYNTRLATGSAPTLGEVGHDVLAAGVGGAAFGGLFRASHLAIRKMIGAGADVPPAVRDAALVVESRDLYGDKNALGVPAAAHEAAMDRAVQDVARGRVADVEGITPERSIPTIHEAVREAQPELMKRYDALQEEVRVAREAIDNYPAEMQQRLASLEAEMIAAPRTATEVADFQQRIRQTETEVRAAQAFAEGTGPEPMGMQAQRAQLQVIDAEMRDMLPKIREAHAQIDEPMAKLGKMMDEPSEVTQPFTPPEEPTAGRPTEAGSPQDKTMDVQVKQLLEEGGGATPEARRQYEAILQQEKETNIAIGCVGGGAL